MNNSDFDRDDMEDFFDNLLDEQQREEFLDKHQSDEAFERQLQLQDRINQVLLKRFHLDVEENPVVAVSSSELVEEKTGWLTRRSMAIVLAASFIGILVYGIGSLLLNNQSPHFSTTRLAQLYQQEIERGFKPYYECHDMQRFADTFNHRLGIALTLSEMPDDRSMLGISYLGGLSRMTISMLCEVKGVPVIVFVDIDENANDSLANMDLESELSVFRQEKDGIIFYEVTPHSEANMIDYFEFPDK